MKRSVVLGVVGLAVVAVGGGLTGCAESPAAGHAPAPVAVVVQSPVAANESAPASPRQTSVLDLSSKLRFTQSGAVMTVMRHSAEVASVKLTSATYTDSTAHAVFTVTAWSRAGSAGTPPTATAARPGCAPDRERIGSGTHPYSQGVDYSGSTTRRGSTR